VNYHRLDSVGIHETATARSLEQRNFFDSPAFAASGQVPGR
jgi:hypothetical protein